MPRARRGRESRRPWTRRRRPTPTDDPRGPSDQAEPSVRVQTPDASPDAEGDDPQRNPDAAGIHANAGANADSDPGADPNADADPRADADAARHLHRRQPLQRQHRQRAGRLEHRGLHGDGPVLAAAATAVQDQVAEPRGRHRGVLHERHRGPAVRALGPLARRRYFQSIVTTSTGSENPLSISLRGAEIG